MTALLAGACNDGVGSPEDSEGGEDGPAPSASFTGSPTSGAAPLNVAFEDQSTGDVTSWTWDFGDGGSSTQASPSHTYVVAGLYTVRLTVRGPTGSDTFTRASYISVGNQPPVVNFGAAPTMGAAPLAVTFADLSTGNVSRWLWNFGDGATSTLRNPSHTYANAGTYDVMLTVSGSGGTNQLLRRGFIVVRPPPPVADFRGAPTVGSAPLSVSFTESSTGATAWLWDFGDGSSSTLRNPTKVYRANGFYNVTLAVSGPGGTDVETKYNYIAVGDLAPVANFAASPTIGVAPLAVAFTDRSGGNITAWQWRFGDGATSSQRNPTHSYTASGTYDVTLTVGGPTGTDSLTLTGLITVTTSPPPRADFSGRPTTGDAPLTVSFTNLSTGDVTSWAWVFGDQTGVATQQNPSHVYRAPGTYTVRMQATGPAGSDLATKTDYIRVTEPPPVANFRGTPTAGSAPLTVSFTDLSTGTVSARLWDFGDGFTSTAANPSHTYAADGVYDVVLTVAGPSGVNTLSRPGYITVSDGAPTAAFAAAPTSGAAPLAVSFADQSTGDVTSWQWVFGDGGTSTQKNPSHTYSAAGTYSVTLTVSGPSGSDTLTRNGLIQVTGPAPTAEFRASPTSGVAPLAVAFTDLSSGSVTGWQWSFGDGGSSTQRNPSHTYSAPGQYTVTLTATGPGGRDTETKSNYITVTAGAPVANFVGSPTSGVAPLAVAFTDQSTGNVTGWQWSFGDGGSSTLRNPSHTYAAPGTYTVALTVTGPGGRNTLTKAGYITVSAAAPVANFTGSPTSGTAPLVVAFTDLSTGNVTGWQWSFGDGGSSTLRNPSHTYSAAGSYTVSLTVSGPGGSNTLVRRGYVTVTSGAPVANFNGTPRSGFAPLTVAFTDLSTGSVTGWQWSFGDGGSSTAQHPSHVYSSAGSYTVSLTASGPSGSNTLVRADYVVVSDSTGGTTASVLTQHGITWTFDRAYEVGQFANGDWWVVGPVTITGISPRSTNVGGRVQHGSMVNPLPRQDMHQGFDTILYGQYDTNDYIDALNAALNVSPSNPLVLGAGRSLVSSITFDQPTRYLIKTAAILTVLARPAPPGSLRPAYVGDDKTIRFNESQLDYTLLARLPPTPATPSLAAMERQFERVWLDFQPGWLGEALHPEDNMPGYGRDLSSGISEGAVMLHLDFTDAQKRRLLLGYVQVGIDYFGVVQNGGQVNWIPNGGHASGRKWPILFAGLMLGDPQMSAIGLDTVTNFGEDGQTFVVEETSPGVYNNGHGGYGPQHVGMPEWGIRHSWEPQSDSVAWLSNYRGCCTANAWNGFVLAVHVMGAESLWGHQALLDYMDRYIPTSRAMGDPEWQTSWSDFTIEVWDTWRSRF